MSFDVVMPQMGESITEATILKWHRQAGEAIGKDETLYEISTDKVDAEIPAPIAGTILEILVEVNATVPVGTVVARIGAAGEKPATAGPAKSAAAAPATDAKPAAIAPPVVDAQPAPAPAAPDEDTLEGRLRTKSSPLVRRMAEEHGVDLRGVPGSGIMGRVTKQDMEAYLAKGPAPAPAAAPAKAPAPPPPAPSPSPPAKGSGSSP